MYSTLIYGAGSIGNHLGHACRAKGWAVTLVDTDPAALERTRRDIYPARYGAWDEEIELVESVDPGRVFDLVIIGTPPESHLPICIRVLEQAAPRVLLIEKPLCTPDMEGCEEVRRLLRDNGTVGLIGYNHNLTRNTVRAAELIAGGLVGEPQSIMVRWLEHWGGIFKAHPWLDGPADSYLGFARRGGGACAEHSHGIGLFLHACGLLEVGPVREVGAMMDMHRSGGAEYDRSSFLSLRTDGGLVGCVVLDVVTNPPQKTMRIQGADGFLEWYANYDDAHDALRYQHRGGEARTEKFAKSRPDDFAGEIDHIEQVLREGRRDSPIDLERGIDAMEVIAAAHLSNQRKRLVKVDARKPTEAVSRANRSTS